MSHLTTPMTPSTQLTQAQVCDLPMADLLAQVDVHLDTTEINEPNFFGYITVDAADRATIHIPSEASDLSRDIATRFLIATHLGLPTDLFPGVLQATVVRDGKVQP